MADLAIRNVPERLLAALSERAARHQHTLEQEAIECLDVGIRIADGNTADVERRLTDLRQFRSSLGSLYVSEEELREAKREGRP